MSALATPRANRRGGKRLFDVDKAGLTQRPAPPWVTAEGLSPAARVVIEAAPLSCRYVLGTDRHDFSFCGAPVVQGSHCLACHRLTHSRRSQKEDVSP